MTNSNNMNIETRKIAISIINLVNVVYIFSVRIHFKMIDQVSVNLQNIPNGDREPGAGKSGRLIQLERLMHRIDLPDGFPDRFIGSADFQEIRHIIGDREDRLLSGADHFRDSAQLSAVDFDLLVGQLNPPVHQAGFFIYHLRITAQARQKERTGPRGYTGSSADDDRSGDEEDR